jgi:hypothetical protein
MDRIEDIAAQIRALKARKEAGRVGEEEYERRRREILRGLPTAAEDGIDHLPAGSIGRAERTSRATAPASARRGRVVVVFTLLLALAFVGAIVFRRSGREQAIPASVPAATVSNEDSLPGPGGPRAHRDSPTPRTQVPREVATSLPHRASEPGPGRSMPCWVVCVGVCGSRPEAERLAETYRARGFSTGSLWIPDYGSLSGARMWLTFIGPIPYVDRTAARGLLLRVREFVPDAYVIKLAQSGPRETLSG